MFIEQKLDQIIAEQTRLVKMVELFLPNLESERGVIHFLEITKNTFNSYIRNEVFQENPHYIKDGNQRIFIPDEIIKLKKIGVKGKRKKSTKQDTLDAVNKKLGIISECGHAGQKGLS